MKDGYGRWASYRLSEKLVRSDRDAPGETEILQAGSQHNDGSSQHNDGSSQRTDPVLDGAELLAIAAPAREKARLAPAKMRELIWQLCQIQSLTVSQLAGLLNRHPEGIRNRFLSEMVREGALLAWYPDPTHLEQAYRANPDWEEGQSRIQTPAIDP